MLLRLEQGFHLYSVTVSFVRLEEGCLIIINFVIKVGQGDFASNLVSIKILPRQSWSLAEQIWVSQVLG